MNAIVIGCGFSGSVTARILADKGYQVTVYDTRSTVGGNAYDYVEDDIIVHKYGPHIFHTNNQEVWDFLSKYTKWKEHRHTVLAKIDGKLVPLPFNLDSLHILYEESKACQIEAELIREYGMDTDVSVMQATKHQNPIIADFAKVVFEKVFKNYTLKQWGCSAEELPLGIFDRVPIKVSRQNGYFRDKYQAVPKNGFTALFNNLLDSKNITLKLGVDCVKIIDEKLMIEGKQPSIDTKVIFTGCVDELLNNKFGSLPYRSLRFEFEKHNFSSYQDCSVVNYPNQFDYTRITEFSKFTCMPAKNTIIIKEYPEKYKQSVNTPYYPIDNAESATLYNKYANECAKIPNLHLLGRLANFSYINMDVATLKAIELCKQF